MNRMVLALLVFGILAMSLGAALAIASVHLVPLELIAAALLVGAILVVVSAAMGFGVSPRAPVVTTSPKAWVCPNCQRANPSENTFCGSCGRPQRDDTRLY
jgi:hypothetical protein